MGRCNTSTLSASIKGGVYVATRTSWISVEQRAEAWRRWKSGQGVRDIGRTLGFDHGSIRSLVQRGGIAPPARKRAASALTLSTRLRAAK